jgi:hypothetical protein
MLRSWQAAAVQECQMLGGSKVAACLAMAHRPFDITPGGIDELQDL